MAAEPLHHDRSDPSAEDRPALRAARSGGTRRADRQDRVVQSMARKVTRPCRRNGCPAPARASMVLDYGGKQVTLVPLLDEADPRFLEVCPTHAASMDVPRGWDLVDERDDVEEPDGPPTAREMGSSATVAVLAEALRRPDETVDGPVDDPDGLGLAEAEAVEPDAGAAAVGAPDVAPAPTPPSGRISQPRPTAAMPDERQLRLDGGDARRGRPVPAALDD